MCSVRRVSARIEAGLGAEPILRNAFTRSFYKSIAVLIRQVTGSNDRLRPRAAAAGRRHGHQSYGGTPHAYGRDFLARTMPRRHRVHGGACAPGLLGLFGPRVAGRRDGPCGCARSRPGLAGAAWALSSLCLVALCAPALNAPAPGLADTTCERPGARFSSLTGKPCTGTAPPCADAPICSGILLPGACGRTVSSFRVAEKCPASCGACPGAGAGALDKARLAAEDSWELPGPAEAGQAEAPPGQAGAHQAEAPRAYPTLSADYSFSFLHIPKVAGASFIREMKKGAIREGSFYPGKEAGQEHCLLWDVKKRPKAKWRHIVFFRSPRHHALSEFSECRFDMHWAKVKRFWFPWMLPVSVAFPKWVDHFYYNGRVNEGSTTPGTITTTTINPQHAGKAWMIAYQAQQAKKVNDYDCYNPENAQSRSVPVPAPAPCAPCAPRSPSALAVPAVWEPTRRPGARVHRRPGASPRFPAPAAGPNKSGPAPARQVHGVRIGPPADVLQEGSRHHVRGDHARVRASQAAHRTRACAHTGTFPPLSTLHPRCLHPRVIRAYLSPWAPCLAACLEPVAVALACTVWAGPTQR